MLKEFGASHIIIGHSERREYHAESDEFVAKKFAFLKENGLTPVLCIGESEAQNEAVKLLLYVHVNLTLLSTPRC